MSRELSRTAYTDLFGATEGDRLRLGDTNLLAEIETDHATYGDEAVFGGGKTMRDGMGMQAGTTQAEGALDWVYTNVVVIDPVLGVQKGDIGVRNGEIVGVGKAGNPDTMDGVDEDLIIGASTDTVPADGLIATPGAFDIHVHFNSKELFEHALASGITTMFGGGFGGGATTCTPGPENIERFLQAAEEWPMNVGFYAKGNASSPEPIYEQIEAGAATVTAGSASASTPSAASTTTS